MFINEGAVWKTLTTSKSIQLAREAYVKRARKQVIEPMRTWFKTPDGASFYFMPAHVRGSGTASVKVVSVNPTNLTTSLPSTIATVYVYDSKTGQEIARISGEGLTAIRTAASSALASDLLALKDADTLGIIGTGKQAEAHIPAMLRVRDVSRVLVYSRAKAHRDAFARRLSARHSLPVVSKDSARAVARESDIMVLATSSRVPLFKGQYVKPGTHVNAIGASLPAAREMDSTLVRRSILVVDSREQALSTYGDIMIPIREKLIQLSHIRAELGDLLVNPRLLTRNTDDITIFKAGGLAVLDAICANYLVTHHR